MPLSSESLPIAMGLGPEIDPLSNNVSFINRRTSGPSLSVTMPSYIPPMSRLASPPHASLLASDAYEDTFGDPTLKLISKGTLNVNSNEPFLTEAIPLKIAFVWVVKLNDVPEPSFTCVD